MAVDAFIWFEDIAGESQDEEYKGTIEVESFSWGVANPATISSATGGAGAGKAQFQGFNFTTRTSKASPKLMLACASGQHIKKAQLFCRKAGGAPEGLTFVKLLMEDVLISGYSMSGPGDEGPEEQITFVYGKLSFTYVPQNADGKAGTPVTQGWDVRANRAV